MDQPGQNVYRLQYRCQALFKPFSGQMQNAEGVLPEAERDPLGGGLEPLDPLGPVI